jgi:transcriptional regulator with XRE-family HTH domain
VKKLGGNIKKVREFKNLTQTFVAGRLNMSQSSYARIENGNSIISKDQLEVISKILETNPDIIKNFDQKVDMDLNPASGFNPDIQAVGSFFGRLKDLYKEEIILLEKKVKLLETISI